jgi:hypothetical protein
MKKTTNTPGFTAEAALLTGNARYQANADAAVSGGAVQPAGSMFFLPNHPVFCLKFICVPDPVTLNCIWHTTVGTVNPVTRRCE